METTENMCQCKDSDMLVDFVLPTRVNIVGKIIFRTLGDVYGMRLLLNKITKVGY